MRRNIWLLYLINFLSVLAFHLPVQTLYYAEIGGSATAAMLVFTVLGISGVIFEIPTGTFADIVGRKWSYVLAAVAIFLAYTIDALASALWMLLIGSAVMGLAGAFLSGMENAFLFDTLKNLRRENDFKKMRGRFLAVYSIGAALSSFLGGFIAEISIRLTFVMNLLPAFLMLLATLFLQEPTYRKPPTRSFLKQSSNTMRFAWCHSQVRLLLIIGLMTTIMASALNAAPLFYDQVGLQPRVFGYITGGAFAANALAFLLSHHIAQYIGDKATMFLSILCYLALWILATLLSGNWIMFPLILASFLFHLGFPVGDHLLQLFAPADKRATLGSVQGFLNAICFAIASVAIGYLIDFTSPASAIRFTQIFMLSSLIFVSLLKIPRHHDETSTSNSRYS